MVVLAFFAMVPVVSWYLPAGNPYQVGVTRSVSRILCPIEAPSFMDVLVVDALTSLSKVMADTALVVTVLLKRTFPEASYLQVNIAVLHYQL